MSKHLQPQVYEGDYFEVETTHGTEIVPTDVIGRTVDTHVEALLGYLEGKPNDPEQTCEVKTGWLARLSAPGFLDCTAWSAYETEQDARESLEDKEFDDYEFYDGDHFADPGGNSALRAETDDNPRDQPCPSCHTENVLTRADKRLGYQCNKCADRAERGVD